MKIVHICLCGATTDGFSYQENLLAKYHKKMGHDVTIVASQWITDSSGHLVKTDKNNYFNRDGVRLIRIPTFWGNVDTRLKIYPDIIKVINDLQPDILFIHACQFLDICRLAKYVKAHPNIRVYVDNHADYSNSAQGWISEHILHRIIWKYCAHRIEPYTSVFWGVMPARVDFLINLYDLPKDKCKLLVMGADDELAEKANDIFVKKTIRKKYHVNEKDFLIISGGKIDPWKTQTILLMESVKELKREDVKLIVFGSVVDRLKEKVQSLADGEKIQYIGWQNAEDSYRLFATANLAVFPGRHSVYWEQVAGQGIPMIVKDWEGTHHVDLGGNVIFLHDDSKSEIYTVLKRLLYDQNLYDSMKKIAETEGPQIFSYGRIARRSIEE